MTEPEVTIAIPVYNGQALLRTALDSVLSQDFAGFEVLIGDNASTDGTQEIARQYAERDPRVRYVRHDTNVGGWNNFFYLLDNARGRFFSWLAHDDFYETRDHLGKLVEQLRGGCALAFPNAAEVRYAADGSVVSRRKNLLDAFRGADTRFRMSRAAVRCAAHQVYGLFDVETLRSYAPLLREDRDMTYYGEGRFVQALIANERCAFVADITQNFGVEASRPAASADARRVFRDRLRYVRRLPRAFRASPLTAVERALIYVEIARIHLPNAAVLAASICKRALTGALRGAVHP